MSNKAFPSFSRKCKIRFFFVVLFIIGILDKNKPSWVKKKTKKKSPLIYNLQVQILKYDDVLVSKKVARVNDFLFAVSDIPNKEGNIEN